MLKSKALLTKDFLFRCMWLATGYIPAQQKKYVLSKFGSVHSVFSSNNRLLSGAPNA